MKEKRRSRRRAVDAMEGSFRVRGDARVLDVSDVGLAVETRSPLAPGRPCDFRLHRGEATWRLGGTVAWCRLAGIRPDGSDAGPIYRAGIACEPEALAPLLELTAERPAA